MIQVQRKQVNFTLAGLSALFALLAVLAFYQQTQLEQDNQLIAKVLQGESLNLTVDQTETVEIMMAIGYQQQQFNLADEAIETYSRAERFAESQQRVWLFYNLGNLYLKQAVDLAQNMRVDRAVAMSDVAKDFYRSALRIEPSFFAAKYNYEAAQRLSRDLPLGDVRISEESDEGRSEFWSAMPGFPIGLP